ncbi:MFS transporter [Shewanella profunda]|uniref:MFS transporter n=1 Tax=Shewanella profunda TaxID=254793 RepID=UPI00200E2CCC|nr:MFS transporter [Shewanella profunda]MCL1090906.1 MFS transporter [Shewanella profunda]
MQAVLDTMIDSKQRDTRLMWALCVASVVVYINLYLMQGMLPLIAEHFAVSGSKATLILSVTSFSLAFSLLIYAVISDRIGRHTPIVVSLWLLALSNILLIWTPDFNGLLLVRLLQGVVLAAVPAIAMAYFKEQLSPNTMLKAAGIYIMANSIGGIAGRLLGGMMSQFLSWQASMWLLFLVTLVGVALTSYLLPSGADAQAMSQAQSEPKLLSKRARLIQDFYGFSHHLTDPQMRLVYAIGGLTFMMMVNQFSFIQLHLMAQPYEWSRFQATLIFLCYSSGTIASYFTAKWLAKFGQHKLYQWSWCLMLLGSLLTLFDTTLTICAGFLMTACGFFLTHSCCNSFVAMRASRDRAKATSLYLCCYYLGAALGGPYLMMFWHEALWRGVVMGSLTLLALIALAITRLHYHQTQINRVLV